MSGDPGWVKQAAEPENRGDAPGEADATNAGMGAGIGNDTTDGTLLGGRISYRQYRTGYRTGLEPVLMAAAVPARAGQRVLEAGCGAGAGLLCLAARVDELRGVGIEQDADMAALATRNLRDNGLDWPVLAQPLRSSSGQSPRQPDIGTFHHACANPPWHRDASTCSPDPKRDLARRAPAGMLVEWTAALALRLRRGGTLTLALPARLHAEAASAMLHTGFGSIATLPFWPKPDRAARIMLLQGVLGGRGDGVVLPGLVLHQMEGGFTDAADAVLRHAAPLPMRRSSINSSGLVVPGKETFEE